MGGPVCPVEKRTLTLDIAYHSLNPTNWHKTYLLLFQLIPFERLMFPLLQNALVFMRAIFCRIRWLQQFNCPIGLEM